MVYLYKTPRGKVVEKEFPMGKAPSSLQDETYGFLQRFYGGHAVIIPEHMKANGESSDNKIDYEYKRTKTVF